jgi:UDP-3-O-[3-hydroxymyristoyl] N-acetylglucosamine deacetylase
MIKQRTLQRPISASGIGLHTGKKVNFTLLPAAPNTGVVFRRVDLSPAFDLPARAEHVLETTLSTTLVIGDVKMSTIEHLMSAFAGLGIDNVIVEIDAEEVPIMDGSAAPFVFLIQNAGVEEQGVAKKFIRVKKKVSVEVDGKKAELLPHEGFKMAFEIDFDHPVLKATRLDCEIDFSKTSFADAIGRARTFGFTHEIEYLRSKGLVQGGSVDNAIVVDEYRILNEGGLRYDDEFVRHKILDAVGDLYTAGYSLLADFRAYKSGHHLNNLVLRELFAQEDAYEIVSFEAEQDSPVAYSDFVNQPV